MKRFLVSISIFTLPLIVFFSIPLYILTVTGEGFKNIESIVSGREKYLIGYAYNEQNYGYLKYLNIAKSQYNVISAGTSRVLPFTNNMFTASFYNAGYTINIIDDFIPFLENIPSSKTPDYLIAGLDQPMFNEAWNSSYSISEKNKWQQSFYKYPIANTFINVWKDIINRKYGFKFHTDKNIQYIGINAVVNNTGFRNDGSMFYGIQIDRLIRNDPSAIDYCFSNTYERINKGNSRFEYGDSVDVKVMPKLHELLQYCQNRQIKLVAFLPPYADSVFDRMLKSGKYGYIQKIYNCIKPAFDEFGFEIYDFSSASLCDSNDNEMIDGFHGGEVTYLKILIKMLESESSLSNVVNKSQLENDLKNKSNNFIIYE